MIKTDGINFLLVDDLEENLLSLEALLKRDGLNLLKARSGPEALEILLENEVALALLDIQMPGMDGFELAELMRGAQRTRRVPIIFMTAGLADAQRRFRGYEAGAVDFLQKPVESDILKSKAEVFYELFYQQKLLATQRDELQRQAEELKEADRRKDVFLATLAHELRNPLAPIKNGLEILRTSSDPVMNDQVESMMERQLMHLVRLIDDLLDASRITQGKINLRKEQVTLQDVLQSAIESSLPLIAANKHHFTTEILDEVLWVDGDLTRLAQIVSNVLNNASKYTPAEGQISLKLTKQSHSAEIQVSDNGCGIPVDMLPRIFDLFTQVDRNIERSKGGLGIGLALVKRLVEMHGGSILAESAGPGQGSTFTITLPLMEAQNKSDEDRGAMDTGYEQPLRILVVDDNVESAKTIGWMLELLGHEVTVVYDGTDAIREAKGSIPDVILLDIGLPGLSGYDVCRELRKDASLQKTIIIAQTGWGRVSDVHQAKEAGFDEHLTKPISLEKLKDVMTKAKI